VRTAHDAGLCGVSGSPGTGCRCKSGRLNNSFQENTMSLGTILLIVLVLMLVGAIPTWPHSRSWGYAPSGGLGVIAVIIILLLLTGRL
jgi:hypothetical protein